MFASIIGCIVFDTESDNEFNNQVGQNPRHDTIL